MDIRKQQTVEELTIARERLLNIRKNDLTNDLIVSWGQQYNQTFNFNHLIQGYVRETDVEILSALRTDIIELLDRTILAIDSQVVIRSVLQEHILKVKDTKLATLLNEFNATKDSTPNLAAIGFRTILTLIIREKAKLTHPYSRLATKDDLGFEPDIRAAIQDHIFSKAEEKHLERFLNGGKKDTFDNVAHKPGANTLVRKDDLEDAVDLLNSLLPSII